MSDVLNENSVLKTSEFYLACGLLYYDYWPEALNRENPNRVEFVYKRDKFLDDLVKLYYSRSMKVDPIGFSRCIKELKNRLYNKDIEF